MYEHFHLDDYTFPSFSSQSFFHTSLTRLFVILLMLFVWFRFFISPYAPRPVNSLSWLQENLVYQNIHGNQLLIFHFFVCKDSSDFLSANATKEIVWKITDKGIINILCKWRVKIQRSMRPPCTELTKIGKLEKVKMEWAKVVNNDDSASWEVSERSC